MRSGRHRLTSWLGKLTSHVRAPAHQPAVHALAVAAAVLLAGCNTQGITSPNSPLACGGGVVTVAVLNSVTLDCSNGATAITLAGGGASYLVVPQFATGQVQKQLFPYTIGVGGGAVAAVSAERGRLPTGLLSPATVGPSVNGRSAAAPGLLQRRFDGLRRRAERANLRNGRWRVQTRAPVSITPSIATVPVPTIGSLRDFHVVATIDTATPVTKRVAARLVYVGQNILMYVDTLAPSGGFTTDQLNAFGQLFDQTLYPLDLGTFGSPSDIDQNGHVIMLLSPVVNALTAASQCAQGYIAGFFDGFDLVSSDTTSNQGEIFYSVAPDPSGTVSCAHSVSALLADVPSVFLHELQHLINFSQHVLVHHGTPEEGWLDEGMSLVASELGSLYYENRFPPPTGRTDPSQFFPDSAQGYIETQIVSSYDYLLRPDTVTATLHSDADGGLTWRGSDWLLLRWLGDQKGSGFYRQLEETALTGTGNIAAAAGEPFPSLFGDFGVALYTDSIPGVPKSSIPPRDRFTTRTLRQLYQAYFNAAGPSTSVPQPFPIVPTVLTGTVNASMEPGTSAFYQVNTASGAAEVQLQFTAPNGSPLAGNLHPQVSVFRLQAREGS